MAVDSHLVFSVSDFQNDVCDDLRWLTDSPKVRGDNQPRPLDSGCVVRPSGCGAGEQRAKEKWEREQLFHKCVRCSSWLCGEKLKRGQGPVNKLCRSPLPVCNKGFFIINICSRSGGCL